MFDDLEQLDAEFYGKVSDLADELVRQLIDQRAHDASGRRLHGVIAGKALLILGVTYIGASLGLEADCGLGPGEECLKKLQALARAKQRAG